MCGCELFYGDIIVTISIITDKNTKDIISIIIISFIDYVKNVFLNSYVCKFIFLFHHSSKNYVIMYLYYDLLHHPIASRSHTYFLIHDLAS